MPGDDDLVLDRHQASGLAGKALHCARALKGHELVTLGQQRDLSVAHKYVSGWIGGEGWLIIGTFIIQHILLLKTKY